jgi:hypothetical protein
MTEASSADAAAPLSPPPPPSEEISEDAKNTLRMIDKDANADVIREIAENLDQCLAEARKAADLALESGEKMTSEQYAKHTQDKKKAEAVRRQMAEKKDKDAADAFRSMFAGLKACSAAVTELQKSQAELTEVMRSSVAGQNATSKDLRVMINLLVSRLKKEEEAMAAAVVTAPKTPDSGTSPLGK